MPIRISTQDRELNEARRRFHKLHGEALATLEEMLRILPKAALDRVDHTQGELLEAVMSIRKAGYRTRLPK